MLRPILFPICFRISWCCGFTTYHLIHDSFLPAAFQASVFGLFIIYQIAKLVYYLQHEKFENHAHGILHKINGWFLLVIITGYSMEFVAEAMHAANGHEIFNHFCFLILKLAVYVIIELLADFFYARRIKKISPKKRTSKVVTLWDSLKSFFSFRKKDELEDTQPDFNNHKPTLKPRRNTANIKAEFRKPETPSIQKQVKNFIDENRKGGKGGHGRKK